MLLWVRIVLSEWDLGCPCKAHIAHSQAEITACRLPKSTLYRLLRVSDVPLEGLERSLNDALSGP